MNSFCTSTNHTHLPEGRMHPSCCIATAKVPKRWGCRWHETIRARHGRYESVWFQTAMPWVRPAEYNFASVDFTPNYMCTPSALLNIQKTARNPEQLRFIVLMRDPIMRAFSEWSMFALGWGWDPDKNFLKRTRRQMRDFATCNTTLFHNTELLERLPTEELFKYMTKCFHGKAMEYITNSIYPVCVLAALRVFRREQFLFLRFEDLMAMKAPGLIRLLSNFTGLYTNDRIIEKVRRQRQCEAASATKKPLSFGADTKANAARRDLKGALPEYESFFKPYDRLLQKLVHPAFQWSATTHHIK